MRLFVLAPTLGVLFLAILAPEARAGSLQERLQAKLSEPFLKCGDWVFDFDAAKKQAKERKVPIFAYFSRSYAP